MTTTHCFARASLILPVAKRLRGGMLQSLQKSCASHRLSAVFRFLSSCCGCASSWRRFRLCGRDSSGLHRGGDGLVEEENNDIFCDGTKSKKQVLLQTENLSLVHVLMNILAALSPSLFLMDFRQKLDRSISEKCY